MRIINDNEDAENAFFLGLGKQGGYFKGSQIPGIAKMGGEGLTSAKISWWI